MKHLTAFWADPKIERLVEKVRYWITLKSRILIDLHHLLRLSIFIFGSQLTEAVWQENHSLSTVKQQGFIILIIWLDFILCAVLIHNKSIPKIIKSKLSLYCVYYLGSFRNNLISLQNTRRVDHLDNVD